jgi:hypothetical protein
MLVALYARSAPIRTIKLSSGTTYYDTKIIFPGTFMLKDNCILATFIKAVPYPVRHVSTDIQFQALYSDSNLSIFTNS